MVTRQKRKWGTAKENRIDSTQLLLSSSLVAIGNLQLSLEQFRLRNQGHSSAEADYNIIYRYIDKKKEKKKRGPQDPARPWKPKKTSGGW